MVDRGEPKASNVHPIMLAGEPSHGTGSTLDIISPIDGSVAATVGTAGPEQIRRAVQAAVRVQRDWRAIAVEDRSNVLRRLARLLDRDRDRLAAIVTDEVGKPISQAMGEVDGAIAYAELFAGIASTQGGEVLPGSGPGRETWIRREPRGVIGAIIPWNFPLALTLRKLSPAVASGNAVILKPAEQSPLSALAVAELAREAGLPDGLLSVLPGNGSTVGESLVKHPDIAFVTMTGSTRAGQAIMHNAADRIIPVSLELGGKAPFIVFDDADLDQAVEAAVATRMMNNGQACVCNERTFVQRSIHREFVDRYVKRTKELILGDPRDSGTDVGPKVSEAELEKVEGLVDEAVLQGATVELGGRRPEGEEFEKGFWYEPTVLTNVPADSRVMREEIFGPVTPIVAFDGEAEAVAMSNDTEYGLSSYLYTSDMNRVMRMIDALESGEVFVNRPGPEENTGFHAGWGKSGIGGDDGLHGYELYSRRKTVYMSWDVSK